MAIDTAQKRASATDLLVNSYSQIIFPDSSISQGDRQSAALVYSGILASGQVQDTTVNFVGFIANMGRLLIRTV